MKSIVSCVLYRQNIPFMEKGFKYRSRDMLLQLYRVLVRPFLQYCVQFWSPYLRKDALAMDGVQQRLTRLILGKVGLRYD